MSGLHPHPTRHPDGHSYRRPPRPQVALDPADWRGNAEYRNGFALFNHGYYWEAHEAWEGLWHAAGRHGIIADLLKGLIALAAAGYKAREGRIEGVRRHANRAGALFASVQSARGTSNPYCGLNLESLRHVATQLGVSAANWIDTSRKPTLVVLPFQLGFVD